MITSTGDKAGDGPDKAKNVKQTEIMIRLRDAILRVSRYFQAADPASSGTLSGSSTTTSITSSSITANQAVSMQADYSMDSHAKDHEVYSRYGLSNFANVISDV